MGNKQSELKRKGYTVVSEDPQMTKVKDQNGDQFVIKTLKADQDKVSDFLLQLNHPHIVHHKQVIRDGDRLYLVLEHCEGGDLAQKIKLKTETTDRFSESEILDWTVKMCMALKYLHDQQILHKNMQPKSVFFTACGAIRLGEFGAINEWSIDVEKAETKELLYVSPEILSGKAYDEKSEVWSLGCIIYEMCMLKCASLINLGSPQWNEPATYQHMFLRSGCPSSCNPSLGNIQTHSFTHIHYGQFSLPNSPIPHVFGLGETEAPGGNPRECEENMQTPHRNSN